ncbi:MAG: divergent polysaccharide deacetylase family protein [Thermodesulfobacteriota bacterium]
MSKKKAPKKNNSGNLKKFAAAVSLLVLFVIISFTAVYLLIDPVRIQNQFLAKKPEITNKKPVTSSVRKKNTKDKYIYEIYNDQTHEKEIPDKKEEYSGRPRIALIIDDIGFDKKIASQLSDLGIPVTLSVLPFTPYGKEIISKNRNKNTEFMMHLPMEPKEYPLIDPGNGALFSYMEPDTVISILKKDLDYFPSLKGVNNHMGSKLTEEADIMNQVFTILKKRDLFFIDSLTSSKSRCSESARLFRVNFAKRDIFIDNIQDEEKIKDQLEKLKLIALKRGTAIGIGHPYEATLKALKNNIKDLKKDVKFVKASSVVKKIE